MRRANGGTAHRFTKSQAMAAIVRATTRRETMPLPLKAAFALTSTLLVLGGCEHSERADHEELTVTVTADGVDYTGSAVREYRCSASKSREFGYWGECKVKGDAVVIPIGKRGYAFLTIDHPVGTAPTMPYDLAIQSSDTGLWTVPLNQAPPLVHFRDIDDPTSVEAILPRGANPAAPIIFKSLTVDIVQDPAELGVAPRYLPWFERARREKWSHLEGRGGIPGDDLASRLYTGSFETE